MTERPYATLAGGSATGVFGATDVLGTLNRQTPDVIVAAASEVRKGRIFPLGLPVDEPSPPLYARTHPRHTVLTTVKGNADDYLDGYYPQGSSQWDGFLHIADPDHGHYNGLPDSGLGIESWAERGIAGRAVLIDIAAHEQGQNTGDWWERREITVADLEAARRAQRVELKAGDILLIYTGWLAAYSSAPLEERERIRSRPTGVGLSPAAETAEYLWDHGVSAVASDNAFLEASPLAPLSLHKQLLCRLGMPIGELWKLDDLARDCRDDGIYTGFFASAPLHVRGGIGSPANALVIK